MEEKWKTMKDPEQILANHGKYFGRERELENK